MKISAESYLRGPVSSSNITEVLCFSSKATGLIVDRKNLSEISDKVLNLKLGNNKNYLPVVPINESIIEIVPSRDLAYSPSSGFDTIIYYVVLDSQRKRFPIGYSKLSRSIGESTLTEVESIYYDRIRIKLRDFVKKESYEATPAEIGELNTKISDPLKTFLKDFKRRKDLDLTTSVESPILITNGMVLRLFPITTINQKLPASTEEDNGYYWEDGKKAPIWIGSDSIVIKEKVLGEDVYRSIPFYTSQKSVRTIKGLNFPQYQEVTDSFIDAGHKFRDLLLPRYISREFIIDYNGGLWSYPYLTSENYSSAAGKTLYCLSTSDNTNEFPLNYLGITQQPLLDIMDGTLVSKESIFTNVSSVQKRIRDIVNTIIPLTLLFNDEGKIWVKQKIGAWFVFDLPQYGIELIQNRTTAVVVPRDNCYFYPVNDKTIIIRTPRELNLYNSPGEWCDQYTMDTIISRFPHSKLLTRFLVGGDLIDESDIFHSPLNRYRKGILPKGRINIVGALNGIIVYYQVNSDNNIQINYL